MKIEIGLFEIFYLSIAFTLLALYFDVHKEHHILTFILNHVIALAIALIISRFITKYVKI
jgi:hypothetical protein